MHFYRIVLNTLLLLLITVTAPPLAAQTGGNTGLSGTVTDPSGAGISNASLNIARTETGEERILRTDSYGNWEARYLTTGTYSVTVEAENFQALTVDGVQVKSGEVATLPLQLGIGQQSESVTVTADAEMLSRTSAAIVRELDARELENLATSSRNFTQLLLLEPGVDANISSLLSNDNANVSPSVKSDRTITQWDRFELLP